jgi:hypothetical protein
VPVLQKVPAPSIFSAPHGICQQLPRSRHPSGAVSRCLLPQSQSQSRDISCVSHSRSLAMSPASVTVAVSGCLLPQSQSQFRDTFAPVTVAVSRCLMPQSQSRDVPGLSRSHVVPRTSLFKDTSACPERYSSLSVGLSFESSLWYRLSSLGASMIFPTLTN